MLFPKLLTTLGLFFPLANGINNACNHLSSYPFAPLTSDCDYNPDVLSDAPNIIRRHGYSLETYNTTTEDGYILTIFRIPPKGGSDRPPVYLQHAFLMNADHWIYHGNKSLAFLLADLGYDVWMGNLRGTTYSQKHVSLSIYDREYWNFNLDQLALYDVRAQLKIVEEKTAKSIIFIGHCMGNTLGFMYAAEYPQEANSLLKRIVATSPAIYLKNTTLMQRISPIILLLKGLRIPGAFYQENVTHKVIVSLCRFFPHICHAILFGFFGDSVQFADKNLLVYYSDWPTGFSTQVAYHFYQVYKTDNFQKYDYGKEGNLEKYGSETPPLYYAANITVPSNLFYGERDTAHNEEDLQRFYSELGSSEKTAQKVPKDNDEYAFTLMDFLIGEKVVEYFYQDLFALLENDA